MAAADERNSALMDRIAKAEEELQSVIHNRAKKRDPDSDSFSASVSMETGQEDRWRQELEARMEDLEHDSLEATAVQPTDPLAATASEAETSPGPAASRDLVEFLRSKPAEAKRASKPAKVLVHVTVEIGDGRSGTIEALEGDKAEDLAKRFIKQHGLSSEVLRPLTGHIQQSIEAVKPLLHAPKKRVGGDPPHPHRRVPRTLVNKTHSPAWVARMSKGLKNPRAALDPAKAMPCTPRDPYAPDESELEMSSVDGLGMSPAATQATKLYLEATQQRTGLDERGSMLSARMRKKKQPGTTASARLYKDAFSRQKKRDALKKEKQEEEDRKIEQAMQEEKRKWGGKEKWGPSARYVVGNDGEQKLVNVHLSLYEESFKRKAKKEQEAAKAAKMEADKENQELNKAKLEKWGMPKISKQAKDCQRSGTQVWERICDWDGKERKKHLQTMRKERDQEQMEDCTFDIGASIAQNPEAGHGNRSAKLVNNLAANAGANELSGNRFDALYNDARQRQLRIEQYQNWYPEGQTFRPDIGPDKYRPALEETDEQFVNRLTYCKQDRLAEQQVIREAEVPTDASTGQKLFQPITGRQPYFERNASGLPIGDYLHSYTYEYADNNADACQEDAAIMAEIQGQPIVSRNSNLIVANVREQQLLEIFSVIDADGDGIVDAAAADMAAAEGGLPYELANEVCPLLARVGGDLDFDQFREVCKDVVSSLRDGPKDWLQPERERHIKSVEDYISSTQQPSFEITLSQKSMALAEQQRSYRAGSLFDALAEEGEVWDERRRNMSEKQAAEELAACTFQPNVERVGPRPNMSREVATRLVRPSTGVRVE